MDENGEIIKRNWEKIYGYVTENEIDVRWILKEEGSDKAHGSLRIVSHPDLKPGFLRAFVSFVTKRTPKTKEEIERDKENFLMDEKELEIYSINENVETFDNEIEDRYQDLEKLFDVKIFK